MPKADSIAQEHGKRNETGKPEDHGNRLCGEDRKFVVSHCFGEPPGHDDEVCECQERPDCIEEQETDHGGRGFMPEVAPPACDCGVLACLRACQCRRSHAYHMLSLRAQ